MDSAQNLLLKVESEDAERSKKTCFNRCNTCGHCRNYTSSFTECCDCYPPLPEYRALAGSWEHCRCATLPFVMQVEGRLRNNIKVRPASREEQRRRLEEAVKIEQERGKHARKFIEADRAGTQVASSGD